MSLTLSNSRIKLSQGLIFWREIGQGPVLIFLHGPWTESSQWLPTIDYLYSDYYCFAPDLLGFGESEEPNVHYSIELQAECLNEYLEALKLSEVYLIGHSLGSWIASSYALKNPDKVKGLVLISPEGVATSNSQKRWTWPKLILSLPSGIFKILRSLIPLFKIIRWQKKIEHLLLMQSYPVACQLLFKRRRAEIQAELLHDRLNYLPIPVLIMQGQKDTPEAISISQTIASLTPKSQLEIFPGVDNDIPQKQPDVVAQYIRDFVTRIEEGNRE